MNERRSSIHSDYTSDDEQPLLLTNTSDEKSDNILLLTVNKQMVETNSTDKKESNAEILLDEIQVDPPIASISVCSNAPARYIIAIWAFFGFFCLFAMRVNLSVAIVAMVAPQSTLNQSIQSCPSTSQNSTKPPTDYEFTWSPTIQGFVLGGFFYGYIFMQILGGNLAEKVGAKWIFGGCVFLGGLLTLLTPLAARTHFLLLILVRFLTGLVCGPGTPSATALWGKWIPISERSTVPPISQTGANFGIIFTTPLVSFMIGEKFLEGWPSAFYVFGVLSCLWFFGWCYFGFSTPDEHPRISKQELRFLHNHTAINTHKHRKTPWKDILTCPPVYGFAIMHISNNYIYYTLLTSLPIYFATILNFNLHQNGFISALPYFGQFLMTIISGPIVDRIRVRKILSITLLRKLQTIVGTIGTCSFLIAIGYIGCNRIAAVICCIFAVAFLGLHTSGALISPLDIASNYAGTLIGITNSLGTIPGFVGPYVVGAITNNNQTIEAWRLIFNISAGIGALGCIAYCILFNGEEQPWNRSSQEHEPITQINT